MECHAEGAKLSDSVELSASVAALRKVPGGEQVGPWWKLRGWKLGLVGVGGLFYTFCEVSQFHSFTQINDCGFCDSGGADFWLLQDEHWSAA